MTNGLNEVIEKLEQQKTAIERALTALREVDGKSADSSATVTAGRRPGRPRRKGGMTPEGRKRLSEALKERWAAKRAASAGKASLVKPRAKRKGGITAAGRKRLSEALKKRWAAKRAAQAVPAKRTKRA